MKYHRIVPDVRSCLILGIGVAIACCSGPAVYASCGDYVHTKVSLYEKFGDSGIDPVGGSAAVTGERRRDAAGWHAQGSSMPRSRLRELSRPATGRDAADLTNPNDR
ncbi:MAG: hypothetical protein R3C19_21270 [Planctomycetaceae bacterium]